MYLRHDFYKCYFDEMWLVKELQYTPVAMCEKYPSWYKGLVYKKLMVPPSIRSELLHIDLWRRYREEVLDELNARDVEYDLNTLVGAESRKPIVLVFSRDSRLDVSGLIMNWFSDSAVTCKDLI